MGSFSRGPLYPAADGALLESSSRLLISSTLKNFQLLTILVVTAEDLGVYTCSVHNALGTAATTAILRKAGAWAEQGPRNVTLTTQASTSWHYQGLEGSQKAVAGSAARDSREGTQEASGRGCRVTQPARPSP